MRCKVELDTCINILTTYKYVLINVYERFSAFKSETNFNNTLDYNIG